MQCNWRTRRLLAVHGCLAFVEPRVEVGVVKEPPPDPWKGQELQRKAADKRTSGARVRWQSLYIKKKLYGVD